MGVAPRAIGRAVLLAVAGIALIYVAAFAARNAMPVSPEAAAIRTAAVGALQALYLDDFPPPEYQGGPLLSGAAVAIRARIVANIGRFFTAPLQARYEPMVLSAVDVIGGTEWDASGELNVLDWTSLTIEGDHATVSFRTTESILRRGGPSGREPAATHRLDTTTDWRLGLIRLDGQWRVETLYGTCLDGCP